MSSLLTSQALVLATAMAVSAGTVILFDLLRDKYFPENNHHHHRHHQDSTPQQKRALKSCISSSGNKRSDGEKLQQKSKKSKKRVRFADDVKDSNGNGELYRRKLRRNHTKSTAADDDEINTNKINRCGKEEIYKMPANHVALYSGILRDRVQRMGYSF